ncbi:MAG: WecB/TagA/CpsF family glycosyltransferase [Acidobacteriaceae bacterium]
MVLAGMAGRTLRIVGVEVTDFNLAELLEEIRAGVAAHDKRIVANHNLHSLYLFPRRELLREFYKKARCSHIDGMPLVWIAKLYGYRVTRDRRITYVDLLDPMLRMAAAGRWRIFYLGSRPEACAKGTEAVRSRYPAIAWESAHGYFDVDRRGTENLAVLAKIAAFRPDILMVGMGMPRQEEWIARNLSELDAGVLLPCGAAVDYLAGAIPTPPRWAGRTGLEWLFRLYAEPRRLGSRYLVEPWSVLAMLLRDLSRRS